MVGFALQVRHFRPLAAIVAAHGATDLGCWHWPPWYVICCFAPMPPVAVTGMFIASSLVHFSEDIGPDGSIALHSLAGVTALLAGHQAGLEFMTCYLSFVHTPLHYARCWRRGRWASLVAAACATLAALRVMPLLDVVSVSDTVQRIVSAHVWTEWSVSNNIR